MATASNPAAATLGHNNPPAEDKELKVPRKLLDAATKYGSEDTRGANALANLALLAVEQADAGKIDARNANEIYVHFQAGKLGITPEVYLDPNAGHAPSSLKNQVSKLAAIIKVGILFRKEEYAGLADADAGIFASGQDALEWARDFHVNSLKNEESKKFLKDGSTYNAIVTVAQTQISKEHKDALLTADEVQNVLTKEVTEPKEKTLGDILLSIVKASYILRTDKIGKDDAGLDVVTREGIDKDHEAIFNVEQIEAHALEALAKIDPEALAGYQAEIAKKAQAEADRKAAADKKAAEAIERNQAKSKAKEQAKLAKKLHPENELAALLTSDNPKVAELLAAALAAAKA